MKTQRTVKLFAHGLAKQRVSVIIPLYNYERYIVAAMASVAAQTYRDVALIVVDDCSSDQSTELVKKWMMDNRDCGLGLGLWRNKHNARLAVTRNTGVQLFASEFCFFLDADNLLYPRCIEAHVTALDNKADADAAYGLIEVFGARSDVIGNKLFDKAALKFGNYIDAMSMIRRSTLDRLSGFEHINYGWEDYDFWLRLCESGGYAVHIPEILSRYREHSNSMLRTLTNLPDHIRHLHRDMTRRHPWLQLS